MARRPLPSVSHDFAAVVEHLRSRHLVMDDVSPEKLQLLRSVHSNSYSLIIWKHRLSRVEQHSHVFAAEIASDAIQIIPQILLGYRKTTKLLMRSVLENTLRHIYFSDHPVEYLRMNKEAKWFLSMEQLSDYVKHHPVISDVTYFGDAVSNLFGIYSELSAGVHGRRRQDLEMRESLQSLLYSDEKALKDSDLFKRCTGCANFLLSVFNKSQMRKFPLEERRAILHTMPSAHRLAWIHYEWS